MAFSADQSHMSSFMMRQTYCQFWLRLANPMLTEVEDFLVRGDKLAS